MGSATPDTVTKADFIAFLKRATDDKSSEEYAEIYIFLFQTFVEADADQSAAVDLEEFDAMIEIAAAVPRRYGLAPTSESMYPSRAARIAARKEAFERMDLNGNGRITLDEWVSYAFEHIFAKVRAL